MTGIQLALAVGPVRLSEVIRGYPINVQRRIHTEVIRAVGRGDLRGVKLRDPIHLPHVHDSNRMVKKSDVAFTAEDCRELGVFVERLLRKNAVKSRYSTRKPTYQDFLNFDEKQLEEQLQLQLQEDQRMKGYRKADRK